MTKRLTAKIVNSDIFSGDKLYFDRAKNVLPYLVSQAKAGQTIYYSDLAKEVGMPNPRNLNFVLGAIGNAMIELSKQTKIDIPPIQCVVVNKRDGLPGEGIGWFISATDFAKLNKTQKQKIVAAQLARIYTFPRWNWVLEKLNLKPITIQLKTELADAKKYAGGGESEQHKSFKEFLAKNPSFLGLGKVGEGRIEYPLPSADKLDILFQNKTQKIGVEVKSSISNASDILRGLFQCVKYKHLIEAEQIIDDEEPDSRVILALEGQLPVEFIIVKNLLGIEVVSNIKINR